MANVPGLDVRVYLRKPVYGRYVFTNAYAVSGCLQSSDYKWNESSCSAGDEPGLRRLRQHRPERARSWRRCEDDFLPKLLFLKFISHCFCFQRQFIMKM